MNKMQFSVTNKTFMLLKESPYVEYKDNATATRKPLCGMENLKGFCIDLARAIEQELNIKFNICLREDNVYGELFENGTWSGMLGQLVRQVSVL